MRVCNTRTARRRPLGWRRNRQRKQPLPFRKRKEISISWKTPWDPKKKERQNSITSIQRVTSATRRASLGDGCDPAADDRPEPIEPRTNQHRPAAAEANTQRRPSYPPTHPTEPPWRDTRHRYKSSELQGFASTSPRFDRRSTPNPIGLDNMPAASWFQSRSKRGPTLPDRSNNGRPQNQATPAKWRPERRRRNEASTQ